MFLNLVLYQFEKSPSIKLATVTVKSILMNLYDVPLESISTLILCARILQQPVPVFAMVLINSLSYCVVLLFAEKGENG